MDRFNTPFGKMQLEEARKTVSAGYEAIYSFDKSEIAIARALPKSTPEESAYRKEAITIARDFAFAKKAAAKYYSNNIVEFDAGIFEKLFAKEDELAELLEATYQKLYRARDNKDKVAVDTCMNEVKSIKAQQKALEKDIKKATNDNSIYNRAAKPYINAKKLLAQSENYARFDEIAAMYEEAKVRNEKAMAEAAAEKERLDAEEKAYAEKLKAEKAAKKAEKKNK